MNDPKNEHDPNGNGPGKRRGRRGRKLKSHANIAALLRSQIRTVEASNLAVERKARLLDRLARTLDDVLYHSVTETAVKQILEREQEGRRSATATDDDSDRAA